MKNIKIVTLTIVFIGIIYACSSRDKVIETVKSDKDGRPKDSVQIRSTSNGNMSNTYPSN